MASSSRILAAAALTLSPLSTGLPGVNSLAYGANAISALYARPSVGANASAQVQANIIGTTDAQVGITASDPSADLWAWVFSAWTNSVNSSVFAGSMHIPFVASGTGGLNLFAAPTIAALSGLGFSGDFGLTADGHLAHNSGGTWSAV